MMQSIGLPALLEKSQSRRGSGQSLRMRGAVMDEIDRAIRAVMDARPYQVNRNERALAEAMRIFSQREGHNPEKPKYLSRYYFEQEAKARGITVSTIQAFLMTGPKTYEEISKHVGYRGRKLRELLRDARRREEIVCAYVRKGSVRYFMPVTLTVDAKENKHEP
jgi:hypothetical protein